jgi:hypothetical protein
LPAVLPMLGLAKEGRAGPYLYKAQVQNEKGALIHTKNIARLYFKLKNIIFY